MTMLLRSFNFIRGKESMKLLCKFNLTKVKQNFFILRAWAFKRINLINGYSLSW